MALGKELIDGVSFYQEGVDAKIQYYNAINSYYDKIKTFMTQDKTGYIEKLKKKEQKFLNTFSTTSVEALKAKFFALSKMGYGLENLSNESVASISALYKAKHDIAYTTTEQKFRDWLEDTLKDVYINWVNNPNVENANAFLTALKKEINKTKIQTKHGKGGAVWGFPDFSKCVKEQKMVYFKTLGIVAQERIAKRMEEWNKSGEQITFLVRKAKHTVSGNANNDKSEQQITEVFPYFDYTHGLTGSQVSDKEAEKIAKEFYDGLEQYIKNHQTLPIPNLGAILKYVQSKPEYNKAIFVGANEKGVIGLLGEVQALCYLSILLDGKMSFNNNKIQWVAKELSENKKGQMHADFLVEKLGLQVKNTGEKQVSNINFLKNSDKGVKLLTFLEYAKEFLTEEELKIIINLYITYYFNVPYNPNSLPVRQVEKSENSDYAATRENLEKLVQVADKLLALMGSAFMFIGLGDASQNIPGNIVFILGGEDLIFASEVVLEILNSIEQEIRNIQITRPPQSSYTIVNFINDNQDHWKEKDGKKYIEGSANRVSALVADTVVDKILMTSSYNFTDLINNNRNIINNFNK